MSVTPTGHRHQQTGNHHHDGGRHGPGHRHDPPHPHEPERPSGTGGSHGTHGPHGTGRRRRTAPPPSGGPAPGPPLGIDGAELKRQAARLREEAAGLAEDLSAVLRGLEGLGAFWGDDDAGRAFHEGAEGRPGYRVRRDTAVAGVNAFTTAYERIADGLVRMAANVEMAEWNVTLSLPVVPR